MSEKTIVKLALTGLLVISIIGEMIALYTGSFPGNKLPMATHLYNIVLVVGLMLYSNTNDDDSRHRHKYKPSLVRKADNIIEYVPRNRELFKPLEQQAEKYYIDTTEIKLPEKQIEIIPDKSTKFDDTMGFDDETLQYIKDKRYKDAAEYLNQSALQNVK